MTDNKENSKVKQTYTIRIESPFILTARDIKDKIGIGYKVVSVETERDRYIPPITDVDSATEAMVLTGYRALARSYHPDLGGNEEVMKTINQAKKEVLDLLKSLKEN